MNWLEFYKSKIFLTSSEFNNTRALEVSKMPWMPWIFTICFLKSKCEHDIYFNFGKIFTFAFQKVNSKHEKDSRLLRHLEDFQRSTRLLVPPRVSLPGLKLVPLPPGLLLAGLTWGVGRVMEFRPGKLGWSTGLEHPIS